MANPRKQKDSETMEEATGCLIYRACELARNLESNFSSLASQPKVLFTSIDEIVKTFSAAKESLRLCSQHPTPSSSSFGQARQPDRMPATSNFMPECPIRSTSYAQPMDQSIHDQVQRQPRTARMRLPKRKSDSATKTVMAPAPRFGDTQIPPEDGFTWRKYGQKVIFGSKNPRSYYRCTHQKLYKCPAKKQVQRQDDNPTTFSVTYRGSHTCVMSSTAPSSSVPAPYLFADISPHFNTTTALSPHLSSSSTSVSQWFPPPLLGLCPGAACGGPSTSRYGNSTDYMGADIADACLIILLKS
ncbi:WRKY transcription factor 55 [Neltuma alba]|uniref:WRKY transcription factor 55 n=1 Tax=Neltuma alba TaxID=207710 RepID=UPI0010A5662B|nr:WRKY transcription factor 55 [Prosopis alba]